MRAVVIQFEWDISDNIFLENNFLMVKKFSGEVLF